MRMFALAADWCSTNQTAAVSALAAGPRWKPVDEAGGNDRRTTGLAGEPLSATAIPMVAVTAATSVAATMLAALPDARSGTRSSSPRTPARAGLRLRGLRSVPEPEKRSRAASFDRLTCGARSTSATPAVSPAGTSARRRRAGVCAASCAVAGRAAMTFGRRRRSRLRRSLCAAPASASGSGVAPVEHQRRPGRDRRLVSRRCAPAAACDLPGQALGLVPVVLGQLRSARCTRRGEGGGPSRAAAACLTGFPYPSRCSIDAQIR